MKNLSLVLNIILLVAVAVLFYLHFSGPGAARSTAAADTTKLDLKIAYITTDSIVDNYDYLKASQQQLEAKSKKLGEEFRNRAMGLQSEIAAYQRNRNNLTLNQDQAMQQDLGQKQQNLQLYEQSLNQQLAQEEQKLLKQLYDRLTAYCKKYGEQNGLQVILKKDQSSDVLFGTTGLDITNEIIKGLNDEYQAEKNNKTAADSTAAK